MEQYTYECGCGAEVVMRMPVGAPNHPTSCPSCGKAMIRVSQWTPAMPTDTPARDDEVKHF